MDNYFFISIIVSLIILALVKYGDGTSQANYLLTLFGILAWFIPYPLISAILPTKLLFEPIMLRQSSEFIAVDAQAQTEVIFDYPQLILFILIFLTGIGGLLFLSKVLRAVYLKHTLLKSPSLTLDDELSKKYKTTIYSAKKVPIGMVVGVLTPIIIISKNITEQRFRELIATHELKHLEHGDNFKLLFLEFAKSMFWWNPLLRILANKNRFFIEACCDDRASKEYGVENYIKHLAELMLYNHTERHQLLISNATADDDNNISRIKFLKENRKMTKRKTSTYIASLLSALTFMTWNTFAVNDTETSSKKDTQRLGALVNMVATVVDRSDKLEIKRSTTSEIKMWVDFNKKAGLGIGDKFMLNYKVTDLEPFAIFEMEIVEKSDAGEDIIEKPTLKVQYGQEGVVEIDNPTLSSNGYKIQFTLTKEQLPE